MNRYNICYNIIIIADIILMLRGDYNMYGKINSFTKEYSFLSNFYPCFVYYQGERFSSSERAFQAAKCLDKSQWKQFQLCPTNGDAKNLGKHVDLRPDWETVKIDIMYEILKSKFSDPVLRDKLLNTGYRHLEEGNNHGDRFWGTVKGQGRNELGKCLMKLRNELRGEL